MRRGILDFYIRCAREYGDICGFSAFSLPFCMVFHPTLIEQVLVEHAARTKKSILTRQLKLILGHGLVTTDGESWRQQRAIVQPIFDKSRHRRYSEIILDRVRRLLATWEHEPKRDLEIDLCSMTYEIVGEAFLSKDLTSESAKAVAAIEMLGRSFESMHRRAIPVPPSLLVPGNFALLRAAWQRNRQALTMVKERRRIGSRDDDLIGTLLNHRDKSGAPLSDRNIQDQVMTIRGTGTETTAIALAWTLSFIAHYPEIEAELLHEWNRVLGDRDLTLDDLPDLIFTRQVILESMRLRPPVWTFGREATEEFVLGGYRIVPRTQVLISQYVTHRDERFFPDPERFDPARWAPERASSIPKFAYIPFAGGPRHCIGSSFAMMELTLCLPTILRRFHIDLDPNNPIELQAGLTLRPRHGLRAIVRRR